ncbi:hypothetical protein BKA63DRAFT_489020 [Paraphoma chrysanthemicola]|nr:hypothetical protein BKA63DRAFT_489020 [Paraphoma chrysanthemicola]
MTRRNYLPAEQSSMLPVIAVHVKVTGRIRIGWRKECSTPDGPVARDVDRTTEVFSYHVPPLLCGPHSESKSNLASSSSRSYKWSFEIPFPGNLPESVEGRTKSNITYELEAKAVRSGILPGPRISEPLRIIRLRVGRPSETGGDSLVEGDWMGALNYRISVPRGGAMLGCSIPIFIRWRALTDIDVSSINCRLLEIYELKLSAETHQFCKEVARWNFHVLEGKQKVLRDGDQEVNTVSRSLILPRSWRDCTQDVEEGGLKVRHALSITIHSRKSDSRKVNMLTGRAHLRTMNMRSITALLHRNVVSLELKSQSRKGDRKRSEATEEQRRLGDGLDVYERKLYEITESS